MSLRIIKAQSGTAFLLSQGQSLKVIDLEGQQVADLFCYSAADPDDALSSGRSIDYNECVYLTKNHRLYSQSGKPMFTITEDTCGAHDFLVTPCSLQMFQMVSNTKDYHPSCLENLARALKQFNIRESTITTSFNIFMNLPVGEAGRIQVLPPLSKAGDFIVLHAEMDLVVGLTACSDEGTNHGRCKPIGFEIF